LIFFGISEDDKKDHDDGVKDLDYLGISEIPELRIEDYPFFPR
jgi:hypothetical protein